RDQGDGRGGRAAGPYRHQAARGGRRHRRRPGRAGPLHPGPVRHRPLPGRGAEPRLRVPGQALYRPDAEIGAGGSRRAAVGTAAEAPADGAQPVRESLSPVSKGLSLAGQAVRNTAMTDVARSAPAPGGGFIAAMAPYFRPMPFVAFLLGISSGFPLTLLLAT